MVSFRRPHNATPLVTIRQPQPSRQDQHHSLPDPACKSFPSTPPAVQVHEVLKAEAYHDSELRPLVWDMRNHPSLIRLSAPRTYPQVPAAVLTAPALARIPDGGLVTVRCQLLPFKILVKPRHGRDERGPIITVLDIFHAVNEALRIALTQSELLTVYGGKTEVKDAVEAAWRRRCEISVNRRSEESAEPRRMDLLGVKCMFAGLSTFVNNDDCQLHVS